MRKFAIVGLLVVMFTGAVYAGSGTSLPQTASHTITLTVQAAYYIEVSPNISMTVSPLLGDVTNTEATLTYKLNEASATATRKIQVMAEGIPDWLTYLKVVATGITVVEGGPGAGSAAPEVTLSTTYTDFITGISDIGSYTATPQYTAKMETWATAAGTEAVVTVTYKLIEG